MITASKTCQCLFGHLAMVLGQTFNVGIAHRQLAFMSTLSVSSGLRGLGMTETWTRVRISVQLLCPLLSLLGSALSQSCNPHCSDGAHS